MEHTRTPAATCSPRKQRPCSPQPVTAEAGACAGRSVRPASHSARSGTWRPRAARRVPPWRSSSSARTASVTMNPACCLARRSPTQGGRRRGALQMENVRSGALHGIRGAERPRLANALEHRTQGGPWKTPRASPPVEDTRPHRSRPGGCRRIGASPWTGSAIRRSSRQCPRWFQNHAPRVSGDAEADLTKRRAHARVWHTHGRPYT